MPVASGVFIFPFLEVTRVFPINTYFIFIYHLEFVFFVIDDLQGLSPLLASFTVISFLVILWRVGFPKWLWLEVTGD